MPLRLGPALFCLCAAAVRAAWLSMQLSGFTPTEAAYLMLGDAPAIGILVLLATLERIAPRLLRIVPLTLQVVVLAVFALDFFTVVMLNTRLQMSDLYRYGREWWLLPSFIDFRVALIAAAGAGSLLIRPRVTARGIPVALGALAISGGSLWILDNRAPAHLAAYTAPPLLGVPALWNVGAAPVRQYSRMDTAAYRREHEAIFDTPLAATGTSVIVVVVESLSAADSFRTSGARDSLPRFDELSRKGRLFRNFVANCDASDCGLISLISGVPPLHFPTASTDAFREYSYQRSVVASFARGGYGTAFITTVPLQFVSMDTYLQSGNIGFQYVAGQHETPRFAAAPRFGFESPADGVLYDELLARFDASQRNGHAPVLMLAVTASSHLPYRDPLGREDSYQSVWTYVQDELWRLYDELAGRDFFDRGLLIITGDHRRMAPLRLADRLRYGDSAKARVPLLIIGSGVPPDTVDDRLFQQSDLLRMLDRAIRPEDALSPFAVWVEHFSPVYGLASNASMIDVFDQGDQGHKAYRATLRGSAITWTNRPPSAFAVEHALHRQRAAQQEIRTRAASAPSMTIGRSLTARTNSVGVLIGVSADQDPSRDPDDPTSGLALRREDSLSLSSLQTFLPTDGGYTVTGRAFLVVPADGDYWFSMFANAVACLAIGGEPVLSCRDGINEGVAHLTAGIHRFDLRVAHPGGPLQLNLNWLPPGGEAFSPLPVESLRQPD